MRLVSVCAIVLALSATASAQAPAFGPNAMIYVEASEFGQALQGALLKKKVPVQVTTNREKADFFMEETSKAEKEGTGERVAKVVALGVFAGSGKSYEASVNLTNKDGVVLFAHNAKKKDAKGAAEDVANKLKDFIEDAAKKKL